MGFKKLAELRKVFKASCAVVGLVLILPCSAYAVLDLELTQGIDKAIPIAVVPFSVKGMEDTKKIPTDVSSVIANDLHHSGEFKVADVDRLPQRPHTLKEVDFSLWQDVNVDHLVIGTIEKHGTNYRVTYYLLSVYKSTTDETMQANDSVMLSHTYTVTGKSLRRLAHEIADRIYEKLIGDRSVFSTKIAYIVEKRKAFKSSRYYLMIADADGYAPLPILISRQPIMSPSWAPDGKKISYVSFEKRRASIYLSDIATGHRRLITRFSGINGAPSFSHDGKKLALVLSKTGSPKVYILDIATKKLTQITHGFSIDTEPSWAPDDKSLIFTSDRGGRPQIYQVDLATRKIQRLTYDGRYNARASFTEDGEHIVLLHRGEEGPYSVAVQDLSTGVLTVLAEDSNNQSPSVSPNGKMVIFTADAEEKGVLGIVSLDGRVKLRFPESEGSVREPVWGPFFKIIKLRRVCMKKLAYWLMVGLVSFVVGCSTIGSKHSGGSFWKWWCGNTRNW